MYVWRVGRMLPFRVRSLSLFRFDHYSGLHSRTAAHRSTMIPAAYRSAQEYCHSSTSQHTACSGAQHSNVEDTHLRGTWKQKESKGNVKIKTKMKAKITSKSKPKWKQRQRRNQNQNESKDTHRRGTLNESCRKGSSVVATLKMKKHWTKESCRKELSVNSCAIVREHWTNPAGKIREYNCNVESEETLNERILQEGIIRQKLRERRERVNESCRNHWRNHPSVAATLEMRKPSSSMMCYHSRTFRCSHPEQTAVV